MCSLNTQYKRWRNKLAQMDRRESLRVIWAYSQLNTLRGFEMPDDISVPRELVGAPGTALNLWELESIAGEIILNGGEIASGRRSLKDGRQMIEIVQGLRSLENEIYGAQDGADIWIEIWRVTHRQFTFQQKRMVPAELVRYFMIYNDATIDAMCRRRLGLSAYEIFFIDLLFVGAYMNAFRWPYPIPTNVSGLSAEMVDKFLAFSSTELGKLALQIKSTHRIDANFAYRYSPLRQYPLLQQRYGGVDELICPVPVLAGWRVTVGLYYALVGEADFTNALGASFERFCGEVLRRALPHPEYSVSPDARYGTAARPRRTPDWIVSRAEEANLALVIECKLARSTAPAREQLTDLAALEQDFSKLAQGVVQIYARIAEYKQNLWPQLAYDRDRKLYPVIVTMEDWYILGPRLHELLDRKVREGLSTEGVDQDLMAEAPYAVISINDLERLAQVIAAKGIGDVMQAKLGDAVKRTELWHGFLNDLAVNVRLRPTLFEDEFEALTDTSRWSTRDQRVA